MAHQIDQQDNTFITECNYISTWQTFISYTRNAFCSLFLAQTALLIETITSKHHLNLI